jgi:hypothetical protein
LKKPDLKVIRSKQFEMDRHLSIIRHEQIPRRANEELERAVNDEPSLFTFFGVVGTFF